MARALDLRFLSKTRTYEGAPAYDFSTEHPLTYLAFTFGAALFTDGFYESERTQIERFAEALIDAARVDLKFVWQYAAWMRDPKYGKGNRIQGSLAAALLDAMLGETAFTEDYVAKALSHRPDDVTAFLRHFQSLGLRAPSAAARRGMARALTAFDEYQLTKYAEQKSPDVRLCDAILAVRAELEAFGEAGALALAVGEYLHAPSRDRATRATKLPLTAARRALWQKPKSFSAEPSFTREVQDARVTWEQVLSHFGHANDHAANRPIWDALLQTHGLLGDMAFMRNLRNIDLSGFATDELVKLAKRRKFEEVWPHQVYAGFCALPELQPVFDEIFARSAAKLPTGRHLGITDASGSMMVRIGGRHGSLNCMDVALCLTALMSETSRLGASFDDHTWTAARDPTPPYLSLAERRPKESALAFSQRQALRRGMGGTQVYGAVMELIGLLDSRPGLQPPDCLWFFSDMQFHPAAHATDDAQLAALAKKYHVRGDRPPLELALNAYRSRFGHVDVVLWNLAAYAPVPVPADMDGVLLVSGFDTNTFKQVDAWRSSGEVAPVEENQRAVLDVIRSF